MSILIRNILVLSLMVVLAGGISAGTAFAAGVIYVDCDATAGLNNGLSWDDAYTDLQDALNDPCLTSGDQIWVAGGVYIPTQVSDVNKEFRPVSGVAMYGGFPVGGDTFANRDPNQYETILSGDLGGGLESKYVIQTISANNQTLIDGFTISGGEQAIYSYQSEDTIANCIISDNSEDGVYSYTSSPSIVNCIIENNTFNGVYAIYSSAITVKNCIIRDNGLSGINDFDNGTPVVTNCWIYNNGDDGVYLYRPQTDPVLRNNTIVYNDGYGIYRYDVIGGVPEITNCILWGNLSPDLYLCNVTYSCVEDEALGNGTGNIFDYPEFTDPNNNDWHLKAGSPCIEAGDPSTNIEDGELDIDGEARVYNDRIDIGADEYVYHASVVDKSTDINGDGIVDYRDFALQAAAWQSLQGAGTWNADCDINNDGVVNIDDLRKVAFDWLYITGDLDDDGIINYVDFAIFSSAWDSQDGEFNYNPDYDFDGNGFINMDDLLVLVNRWL